MKTKWTISTLIAGLAIFLPAMAQSQRTGHQQVDRLIKRAESTIQQISLTRLQADATIEAYKALVEDSGDSRSAFKDLTRELDRLESRRARTGREADRMETSAAELFEDWRRSIDRIDSEELSAQARKRQEDTQQRYDELIALGREAGEAFSGFAGSLRDQLVFVEHDLNPEALESLRDYAPTFDEKSAALFRKINSTVGTASRLIDSMRSP